MIKIEIYLDEGKEPFRKEAKDNLVSDLRTWVRHYLKFGILKEVKRRLSIVKITSELVE